MKNCAAADIQIARACCYAHTPTYNEFDERFLLGIDSRQSAASNSQQRRRERTRDATAHGEETHALALGL